MALRGHIPSVAFNLPIDVNFSNSFYFVFPSFLNRTWKTLQENGVFWYWYHKKRKKEMCYIYFTLSSHSSPVPLPLIFACKNIKTAPRDGVKNRVNFQCFWEVRKELSNLQPEIMQNTNSVCL